MRKLYIFLFVHVYIMLYLSWDFRLPFNMAAIKVMVTIITVMVTIITDMIKIQYLLVIIFLTDVF